MRRESAFLILNGALGGFPQFIAELSKRGNVVQISGLDQAFSILAPGRMITLIARQADLENNRETYSQLCRAADAPIHILLLEVGSQPLPDWLPASLLHPFDVQPTEHWFISLLDHLIQIQQHEVELFENREWINTITDQSLIGIAHMDEEGTFLQVNPYLCRLLDRSESELLGKTWFDMTHPDDHARDRMLGDQVIADTRQNFLTETRFIRPDGSQIYLKVAVSCVRDGQNRPKYFIGLFQDVTEKLQAREAEQLHHQYLQEMAESAPNAFLMIGSDLKIMSGNRQAAELFGYQLEDLIGMNFDGLLPEKYRGQQTAFARILQQLQAGATRRFEAAFLRKDGKQFPAEMNIRPLHLESGQVIIASIEDITQRKMIMENLLQAKQFNDWLIETASVMVLGLDQDGNVQLFNRTAEEITGYQRQEVLGKNWFELVVPRERYPYVWEEFERLRAAGKFAREFENPILTKDGRERIILWQNSSVHNPANPIALFSFGQDITERRLAEQERERNKLFFETLFQISPVAIVILNNDLLITDCNPAFEDLFGWQRQEILGQSLDDLVNTEETMASGAYMSNSVRDGRPAHGFFQRRRKDGTMIDVEVFGVPVLLNDEKIGVLAIYHDITDLTNARHEAEAANEAKSAFLAMMSHEIRTPMNAIIGMTSLLGDTPLTEEQQDFVETIRTSGDALLTLINDILDFSKIESGKMELEKQPFELQAVMEEAIDLVAMRATEKELDLILLVDEKVPGMIIGDVTRVRQILVNLLSNAVKFTERGEVVLEAKMDPQAPETADGRISLLISVRDTGIGIPPDKMNRLFKSFSQVDSSTTRQYGGTGLGLAISKRLTELMGGTMWVESTVGKGSTFYFTLPVQTADGLARPHRAEVDVNLEGKRVLLVDDNPTNLKLLSHQSKTWGMIPVLAASGPEALTLLARGEAFDLAVLDMQMPEMDGVELAQRIRALPGTADMPMIMLTSLGYRDQRATADLFSAFLNKPIKTNQLFNTLVSVLAPLEAKKTKTSELKVQIDPNMGVRLPLHILLAEDNLVNQKVATRMLQKLGFRADVVANGVEVLQALGRQFYDVVFLDVQMPEMDGLEAARRIRQMFSGKLRPRLIAMTAAAMQGDRELCFEAGMDDYISKPVRPEELVRALEQCRPRPVPETAQPPAEPPTRPEEKDEDIASALSASLGFEASPDILLDLVTLFLQETPSLMDTIRVGLAEGDWPAMIRAAHTLKSNGATFGAEKLRELAAQIEQNGREGKTESLAPLVRELQQEYSRFRAVVERAAQKLR